MQITCGSCQSSFNLNLDGIHHQRFQFKCPSCATLILVDRSSSSTEIKVARADSASPSDGAAASSPGAEDAPEGGKGFREAPTDRIGAKPAGAALAAGAPAKEDPKDAIRVASKQAVPEAPKPVDPAETLRREILDQHPELMKKNYFDLLGVKQDAPLEEVKANYFKLAKQYHPDRFVAALEEAELAKVRELSSRINQAFQELRTEASRQEYIKKLADPDREKKRLQASSIIEAMIDHEKGRLAFKQSSFEVALGHFQRCVALHPTEAEYHFMMAQALMRARGVESTANRHAVEAELRKAVDLQPNNAIYRMGIGHYWKARGDMDKALSYYKSAIKIDPKNHEAMRELRLFESRREKEREERKGATGAARGGLAWAGEKLRLGSR